MNTKDKFNELCRLTDPKSVQALLSISPQTFYHYKNADEINPQSPVGRRIQKIWDSLSLSDLFDPPRYPKSDF